MVHVRLRQKVFLSVMEKFFECWSESVWLGYAQAVVLSFVVFQAFHLIKL